MVGCRPPGGNVGDSRLVHPKCGVPHATARRTVAYLLYERFLVNMILTAIPVVIVFSLCYAATRFEDWRSIYRHAFYFGGWLSFAMILVIAVMEVIQCYLR